jgi:hypothetical protein
VGHIVRKLLWSRDLRSNHVDHGDNELMDVRESQRKRKRKGKVETADECNERNWEGNPICRGRKNKRDDTQNKTNKNYTCT